MTSPSTSTGSSWPAERAEPHHRHLGGVRVASMETALATNQWSDLAISFDGARVQFYVNGAPVKDVLLLASITARSTSLDSAPTPRRHSTSRARSTRCGSTTAR